LFSRILWRRISQEQSSKNENIEEIPKADVENGLEKAGKNTK